MTLTTGSIGQHQTSVGTTQNTAETASTNKSATEKESSKASTQPSNLSDRAQKVQKLNEEFFTGGPKSVKITPEFIQRLNEYGFLNDSEASRYLTDQQSLGTAQDDTVGQLSDFIDDFSNKLREESSESSLVATLEKAKKVLDNLGNTNSNSALDIKTTTAELTQYLNSDDAITLNEEDRDHLSQLQMVLGIADKLQPENLSRSQLNDYVRVLNGF
ncbi:hypothetical protein ACMXYX_06705 [Neptuniibacter sp. QD72_48]|uniref:hypothetical protein n=1 Tax=unclassified Neptuniibacter TaxID=2630693 RepID=UPI0039F55C1B